MSVAMFKPLIVGEAPGKIPGVDGEPLSGRSGRRLASLCRMELPEMLATFQRVNVLNAWPGSNAKGDRFPLGEATRCAGDLLPLLRDRRVVLLGRAGLAVERALIAAGAAEAKGLYLSWFRWTELNAPAGTVQIACCPHPSGVNLWWNDPLNVVKARTFWSALARIYFIERIPYSFCPRGNVTPSRRINRLALNGE